MRSDVNLALEMATQSAFSTDDGRVIMESLLQNIREARIVLPSIDGSVAKILGLMFAQYEASP
jgi:hypothetical protein